MADERLQAYVPRLLLRRDAHGPQHWEADGTLVFADVSGFTRLTEKLSRQGKAGAEEIVRTISDVFTILLTATADGGDVLKFSGDALLLFYEGSDHAQRACHAALTMQRVLRAVGGIDSSRGRVRLRMSVGAHTGRFSFFVCGGDHLELFVLGRATSATVAAESAASAGQVLVSTATAGALDGAIVGERHGDTVVLRSLPALPPITAPVTTGACEAWRYIAPPLRGRLVSDDLEHEHRRATVAFAHFGGVDDLLAREGADATYERVQALTTAAMRALDTYDVLLTAGDVAGGGGTFMLTAGAPDATGDDEARMLRVARSMLDADCGLPLRIGVNAGDLFVGAVGAPSRRTYSTMGAATNLAARVMGAAPWNGVLATTAVHDAVGQRFVITPVPPFTVKGRDAPVEAGLVAGATSAITAAADRSVPFAGRADELALVTEAVADTARDRGGAVEIVGEAGVGKSRLVDEVRLRAGDVAWLHCACDPYEAASPYHTSSVVLRRILQLPQAAAGGDPAEALGDIVAAVAPELLAWLPLIGVAAGIDVAATPESAEVTSRYRHARIHQAVGDLLAAVATGPAVIVLDDAQHMDDASAELIAALMARLLPGHPWLVVVARTDDTTGLHAGRGYEATTVRLGPLEPATATDLAARLAEHTPVPAHALPELVERAAGNPLFLATLVSAQDGGGGELPRSVEAIVAARIDGLDPDDRRALRYLSVLGDRFDAGLLDATLASQGIASEQTDRWRRLAEFVSTDGRDFVFRNALVREVAYEGLAFRRRRQLHALAADALAGSGVAAARLSVHLLRAERWSDAWSTAREAAARARDNGANAVAGELYDMALRAARRLDLAGAEVVRVAIDAGEVWQRAGLWDRALAAYSTAATAGSDQLCQLEITLLRARAHEGAGRYPQALRLYRRTLSGARQLADDAARDRCLARAHAGYASARLAQGRAADAVTHALDAAEHAPRAGDDDTLAQAYHLLDRAHTALGDTTSAAGYRDRALPVFAALGDLAAQGTVLHDLGAAAQRAGRPQEALWLYERGYEARTRAGDVVRAAASANAIGEVLIALDRPGDARERFSEALRTWRGARSPRGVAEATRNLGVVALRDGAHTDALRLLGEAAELAGRIRAGALIDEVQLPLAETLLALGRYVEAWDAASRVLDTGDAEATGNARRLRGEALLRTGGIERAKVELAAALEALTDPDAAATVRGLLAEVDAPTR
ncbi:adenylate/guanylate cyclase domain-containing protein [soil metagenome]